MGKVRVKSPAKKLLKVGGFEAIRRHPCEYKCLQQQSHASPASEKNHQNKVNQEARLKQQLASSNHNKVAGSSNNKVDSSTAYLVKRPQP